MCTKVEPSITAASSAASSSTSKISMFKAKSGFVIPKNKLSGSLVPLFRGGKKLGGTDTGDEESPKLAQRKTKWGPDLTQDPAARKGRALAYQTRVDQITQQLKLGILEIGDNQDSPSSAVTQITSEKSKLLELERREAIGEIIKLNPSYKAPLDYKPLLKEAEVPIPIKEFPGYNFVGLVFGPASDTQKRLEKETGAKIKVYGTKASGEKCEITPADEHEIVGAYEELYVSVSADTYDKVDAAVALIELLVTPVSANTAATPTPSVSVSVSVSGDDVNVINQSQGTSTSHTIPSLGLNQGLAQPIMGYAQSQFQPYPSPWFQSDPPQSLIHPPSSGFVPPNLSAPILRNPIQVVSSSPFSPSNMPSLFGPRPVPSAGFGPFPQNPPVLQRPCMVQPPLPFGQSGPPRNPPSPSTQPYISGPPRFTGNQTGPPSIMRPLMPLLMSQPGSRPSGSIHDRPLTPTSHWSQPPAATAPPMVPPRGPNPINSQPISSMAPTTNISTIHMLSPVNFPSRPSASESYTIAMNRPQMVPALASMRPVIPNLHPNHASGSMPVPSPMASKPTLPPPPPLSGIPSSISGIATNFTTVTASKPQLPSSGDFTFQPQRPQNPASQAGPRSNSQLVAPTPQTPSFRPAMLNPTPQPIIQGFPRPQSHAALYVGNSIASPSQPRPPVHQMANMPGPFPPRPGNPMQLQQNYLNIATRPQNVLVPNQQFGGNPSAYGKPALGPSGKQQIYDPFSPTSESLLPQQGRRQESDPEYEDLLTSVGLK